ncbi:MAG: hypothetical protein JL56_10160 [Desulfotomaculum sp. BICA1-6]|nr:MAG: hypothetical protein VR67_06315 [Peptococcaceae bacterium BRH_c8a]KJS73475.1 MAG: hypothetical protein JL56_10160 [Desulfotomaculum sp. BICA1-6]
MKVLIPVDGSDNSKRAINYALEQAKKNPGTQFTLLAVVTMRMEELYDTDLVNLSEFQRQDFELLNLAELQKHFEGASNSVLENAKVLFDEAGIQVETAMLKGDAANKIIQYASDNGIEEIIMGSRGMGTLKSAILGSVAYKVLAKTNIPLTIIK